MTYTLEEVRKATLEYFKGDELPTNVWIDKYCLKDKKGNYLELTPDDMHHRLTKEFARIEERYPNPIDYDTIYNLLKEFKYFIPAGSPMYGIGNNHSTVSISNCFFIGNYGDSYGSILRTDQEAIQLYKRRGGVGIDISHLRPRNTSVTNSAGTSTGAVSFMERYSNSARETGQQGRRAALMISINSNHPDIEEFVSIKSDKTKVTGANISIKIDDEFMKCVEDDELYPLRFPTSIQEGSFIKEVRAKKLWDKIIHNIWANAEPGLLYWSNIQKESPSDCYKDFKVNGVNPCSEITLSDSEACRLGHMNLYSFVKNPFKETAEFDFDKFSSLVYKSYRLMDDLVDIDIEKIEQIIKKIDSDPEDAYTKGIERNIWVSIRDKAIKGRRIGMGYTGLADTMAALGIKYGSPDGIEFTKEITKSLAINAYKSSVKLAKERGAFPIYSFNAEINNPFINRIINDYRDYFINELPKYGRRNITSLTLAPTGTTSLMADNISSGIEPVYQLSYKRRRKVSDDHPNKSFKDQNGDWWEEYTVVHPKLEIWYNNYQEYLIDNEYDDAIKDIPLIEALDNNDLDLNNTPYNGSTAYDITPEQKVRTIAAAQQYIDAAISNTLNFKENAKEEDISNAAMLAWKLGLKGYTCYRDKSRTGVLVSNEESNAVFDDLDAVKRPKSLECDIIYTTSKGTPYNVLIGLLNGRPYEVFATTDLMTKKNVTGHIIKVARSHYKVNGDINRDHLMENMSQAEKMATRGCSVMLRHRVAVKYVVDYLYKTAEDDMQDFNKVLARVLKRYIKDEETITGATCDNCGSTNLIYKDGCSMCLDCNSSKCS